MSFSQSSTAFLQPIAAGETRRSPTLLHSFFCQNNLENHKRIAWQITPGRAGVSPPGGQKDGPTFASRLQANRD